MEKKNDDAGGSSEYHRDAGFLLLYRKAMDAGDPFWSELPMGRWRARWDVIAMAAFRDRKVWISGQDVKLRRGEFFASHAYLAKRWGWTVKKVRGFMAKLVDLETIEESSKHRLGTIYRVRNYDHYQRAPRGGQ